MKQGQQMLDLLAGLDGDALKQKMAENGITLEDLQKTIINLQKTFQYWLEKSKHYGDIADTSSHPNERKSAELKTPKYYGLFKKTRDLVGKLGEKERTLKAQAEYEKLAKFREKGVSDINEVKNNPKLNELFKELQMTWTIEKEVVHIEIKDYINYDAYDPEYDESLKIYRAPKELK